MRMKRWMNMAVILCTMLLLILMVVSCAEEVVPEKEMVSSCATCHSHEDLLKQTAAPEENWEEALVDDKFLLSTHGRIGCVICHGGDSSAQDKQAAHQDLVVDPSVEGASCKDCHSEIVGDFNTSLHATVSAMICTLETRAGAKIEPGSPLGEAWDHHCSGCHSSCGQCHVSQPDKAGGGLVERHMFVESPSMEQNCTICHDGRIRDEYLGKVSGISGDVHWTKLKMVCTDCHGDELHGTGELPAGMYHKETTVKCGDCHQYVWANTAGNPQHEQHLSDFSCQVCHSTGYKNCWNCHAGIDEEGKAFKKAEAMEIQVKIGLNQLRSSERPYKYVVVRHLPISPSMFDYYGENVLPNVGDLPTWKYATPHVIQLRTPQNESCDACHGNRDLFLTEEDVSPAEREANKGVIVPEIPEPK